MDKNSKIRRNVYALLMSIASLLWIPVTIAPYAQTWLSFIIICVFWLLMAGCLYYVVIDILSKCEVVDSPRRNMALAIAVAASIALLLLTRYVINNVYAIALGAVVSIYLARTLTRWSCSQRKK